MNELVLLMNGNVYCKGDLIGCTANVSYWSGCTIKAAREGYAACKKAGLPLPSSMKAEFQVDGDVIKLIELGDKISDRGYSFIAMEVVDPFCLTAEEEKLILAAAQEKQSAYDKRNEEARSRQAVKTAVAVSRLKEIIQDNPSFRLEEGEWSLSQYYIHVFVGGAEVAEIGGEDFLRKVDPDALKAYKN